MPPARAAMTSALATPTPVARRRRRCTRPIVSLRNFLVVVMPRTLFSAASTTHPGNCPVVVQPALPEIGIVTLDTVHRPGDGGSPDQGVAVAERMTQALPGEHRQPRWRTPSPPSTCPRPEVRDMPRRAPALPPADRPGHHRRRRRAGLRRVHPVPLHRLPGRPGLRLGRAGRAGHPVLHQPGDRALHPGHRGDRAHRVQPVLAALGPVLRDPDLLRQPVAGLGHQLRDPGHVPLRRRRRSASPSACWSSSG